MESLQKTEKAILESNGFFVKKILNETVRNRNNPDWVLKVGSIDIKRDFGYSPNYVEAMWLMLQADNPDDFIICSGKSITLRSIIEYVFNKLEVSQDKLIIDPDLMRPTDIEDIYGDNTPAKTKLGWQYNLDFYQILDILIEEELEFFKQI